MTLEIETTILTEGRTRLVAPALDEPKMIPAFFNPKGKFVRDVSIVCYNAYASLSGREDLIFADALAGIGARGIRVAKEVSNCSTVYLNDINSTSLELAKRSAALNNVESKCKFSRSEVCSFLITREASAGKRFDVVDVDPFGTPADFVDCAIRAVNHDGLLSVAATDSAVLCGVYPRVAQRKYLGLPLRTDYCHEIGMRLLFGLLAMTAMRLEASIQPLFCHHDMHYFRAYCQVKVGNRYSRAAESAIGYVLHCFNCGYRTVVAQADFMHTASHRKDKTLSYDTCPSCRSSGLKVGGPLWIGKIQSQEFIEKCASISELAIFHTKELDIPLYYDLTTITEKLGTRTPRINEVISNLESAGYRASRTRLNPKAVRTDAPLEHLRSVLEQLVR